MVEPSFLMQLPPKGMQRWRASAQCIVGVHGAHISHPENWVFLLSNWVVYQNPLSLRSLRYLLSTLLVSLCLSLSYPLFPLLDTSK